MAVKSIIDVQVNSDAFVRFQALFKEYQDKLKSTPAAWRNIAVEQGKSTKAFQELVGLEVESLGHQKMMAQVQAQAARATRTTSDAWRDMARNTKSVAGNITDATVQLLKWTSLTSVFSGVIGAGGLFGINRMAEGVASGRRSSMGIGAAYGEQKAYQNAFGRFVDTDSVLTNVNQALHSAGGKVSLFGAGMKAGDLNGSTADVSVKFLGDARRIAKQSNPNFDVETMRARGLDRIISLQDFERLRGTSDQEFNAQIKRYRSNVGAFGVSGKDQLAYQNFVTAIDEAQDKISAVFVRGLVPLMPGLEKLSTSVTKTVEAFLGSKQLKESIDGSGAALQTFATYVGGDEFQNKVKAFVHGIGDAADWITSTLARFGFGGGGSTKGIHDRNNWAKHHRDGLQTQGELRRDRANGTATAWSQLGHIIFGGGTGAGVPVKAGAGFADPNLKALADDVYRNVPGLNRVTAFNDTYHKGTGSAHADNRAFDITVNDPAQSDIIAAKVRAELARYGIKGKVINEYTNPSSRATGGHLHVQTDRQVSIIVSNAPGSSVSVAASQLGAGVPQ